MADRAMMYCPRCDAQNAGLNVELMRDNHTYTCMFGHQIVGYENLMTLYPRLIQLVHIEKPGVSDVKREFWIDAKVLEKFEQMYPNQRSATVNSILSIFTVGQPVIIDGAQAEKLRKMGVKNGAEMIATVEASKSLEAENDDLKQKLDFIRSMMRGADVESPV